MKKTREITKVFGLILFILPLFSVFGQSIEKPLVDPEVNVIHANYQYEYVPDFTYEEVKQRIDAMDSEMAFELNDRIFSFIQYFAVRNRDYTKMVMGRKEQFFPMFDSIMAKHEMPLEIKYLSIIESGLDPQIRSRVGAMGLWQFMPATGRMYGMTYNQDIDDRMEPVKATESAAKYLKSLYRMFGDWEVAMAAYNCGPGNVRKAIRRSGGKTTFWEIYNYLPRETRGYVPQFQAMLYLLNHLEYHNFHLEEPNYSMASTEVRLNKAFNLEKLAELTNLCVADLEVLNPSVKNRRVPEQNKSMAIRIPKARAAYLNQNLAWISDSLSNQPTNLIASASLQNLKSKGSPRTEPVTYSVRSGDVLGSIAQRHGVTVSELKYWNNLSSNLIRVGQKLYIEATIPQNQTIAQTSTTNGKKTYVVQPGDSLWVISRKYAGLSVEDLKRLNNLRSNSIKPGQTLVIG